MDACTSPILHQTTSSAARADHSMNNATDQSSSLLKGVTAFLTESRCIQKATDSFRGKERLVCLRVGAMYDHLTHLYASLFKCHWHHFEVAARSINPAAASAAAPAPQMPISCNTDDYSDEDEYAARHVDQDKANALARIYIAGWLIDLYVCNRNATRLGHALMAFYSTAYKHEVPSHSLEYDLYLVLLNSIIRPTIVNGTLEETMFTPVFPSDCWKDPDNPFCIKDWQFDFSTFHCILGIMKFQKVGFKVTPVHNSALTGRAAWLLDWWDDSRAYAFFPEEGNYTLDDISLVYILGTACTEPLGPRDKGMWTKLPDVADQHCTSAKSSMRKAIARSGPGYAKLAEDRSFYGAAEECFIESKKVSKRMKVSKRESDKIDAHERREVEMFRANTFTYYCQIIREADFTTRLSALRTLLWH